MQIRVEGVNKEIGPEHWDAALRPSVLTVTQKVLSFHSAFI